MIFIYEGESIMKLKASSASFGSQSGFSLIELLIVVAIIGILSAIAIPQFSAYRVRAYNASALSDVNLLQKIQGAMTDDWQVFGVTTDTGAAVPVLGNGIILSGPSGGNDGLAGIRSFMPVGISRGVQLLSNTDVAGHSFLMMSKHTRGNRIFGIDSDVSGTSFKLSSVGLSLTGSGINLPSVLSANDFLPSAGWQFL